MTIVLILLSVMLAAIVAALVFYMLKTRKLLRRTQKALAVAQSSIDEAAAARGEMRSALKKAEYEAKQKTNFLATMSHEIRTPLNAVVGFSEFLASPEISIAKVNEYARGITLSANALLSLINDILDLSKLESGNAGSFDIRNGECDLAALFAEMLSIFRMRVERKGVKLSFGGAEQLPPLVLSEPRMRQILLNLLGNAAKFTERGEIAVSARYEGETLRLKVADTGIGISPRGIERIFDPFVQDMEGRKGRIYEGTGLGLPIIKRIVEASQGRIAVDSIVGKGSTFTVEIPQVRALERKAAEPKAADPEAKRELGHVVIVDDVALNRKVLSMHCMALGIGDVHSFESGEQVLGYLADPEHPCELLLSDVWMPEMDGVELARRCAKLRPQLPIVAITADATAADFDVSVFRSVLPKPVTAAKLSETIGQVAKII